MPVGCRRVEISPCSARPFATAAEREIARGRRDRQEGVIAVDRRLGAPRRLERPTPGCRRNPRVATTPGCDPLRARCRGRSSTLPPPHSPGSSSSAACRSLAAGREPAAVDALLDALVAAQPPDRRPDPAGDTAPTGSSVSPVAWRSPRRPGRPAGGARRDERPERPRRRRRRRRSGRRPRGAATPGPDGRRDLVHGHRPGGRRAGAAGRATSASRTAARGRASSPPTTCGPVVLDAGGHPRRLAPAVLATWNPAPAAWDDFSWGITPDLAERTRMRTGDFEAERDRRAAALAGHAHGRSVG